MCEPGGVNSGWPQSVSRNATTGCTFSRLFTSSCAKVDLPVCLLPHTRRDVCCWSSAQADSSAARLRHSGGALRHGGPPARVNGYTLVVHYKGER